MAKAAVSAGADGLIIEVHSKPEEAFSDGAQSLTPPQFEDLMTWVKKLIDIEGRTL
jgi:3-deoxy-7-phosphoheptulonate synthase